MEWKRALSVLLALFVSLPIVACGDGGSGGGDAANPDTLKVAVLPDEDPSKLIKDNEKFVAYLEEKIGKKIELVPMTDYSTMVESMRSGRLHLAYFGPLSYCLCKQKAEIEAFAAKTKKGKAKYRSIIIGNKAAGIATVADIKGKTMAYGDPASTSSHLIPKSVLAGDGLTVDKDYKEQFLGAHDAVALNVQSGNAQAGGLSEPIFESLVERGVIKLDKVNRVKHSDWFPQYPWAMQSNLAPELKEKIKTAFYELKDEEILKPLKASGFVPIEDKDYDVVRNLATLLGKDLSELG
ncbi:MAG: phosphate/phosphite/phosphonate ABC transporter substrate-binding protein [Planctomycetota bacterium]